MNLGAEQRKLKTLDSRSTAGVAALRAAELSAAVTVGAARMSNPQYLYGNRYPVATDGKRTRRRGFHKPRGRSIATPDWIRSPESLIGPARNRTKDSGLRLPPEWQLVRPLNNLRVWREGDHGRGGWGAAGDSNVALSSRLICHPWRLDSCFQTGIAALRAGT